MASITLYGSLTSPYVRRVRIVARELSVPIVFVDAFTDEGQKALRERTPIWKVPVAEIDGDLVFDSRTIVDEMILRHGPGPFTMPRGDEVLEEENLIHVIDGALDAGIKRFYLGRDGIEESASPSMQKDRERMTSCLEFVASRIDDGRLMGRDQWGRADVALLTAIGWFRFRQTYPVADHPALVLFESRWEQHPSVIETTPRLV